MNQSHIQQIAKEMGIREEQVRATAELLEQDSTVPFIARYRKEATGLLDEVQITEIRDRLAALAELDKRREAILKSLKERDLLTPDLEHEIMAAQVLAALEDIYLPYRPKRRTRAMIAKEKGLEPLANLLREQSSNLNPETEAQAFVDQEKGVASVADALAGARDILAEAICEEPITRQKMRALFEEQGEVSSRVAKGKDEDGAKFSDYFDWQEKISKAPSHRILALLRGENEKVLKLTIRPPEEQAHALMRRQQIKEANIDSSAKEQVWLAMEDGYKRLLAPAMETEWRNVLKDRADEEAIRVFAQNLRELLMASPLGQRAVLGMDPGFRTGCKVVCLDAQGKLLEDTVIYPTQSKRQQEEGASIVKKLCEKHNLAAVAIGNGTASRETESFVRSIGLPSSITVVMVNESGASIYSASKVARDEFPDKDVTVRGAVSIGRRLMDPLAELVKLDPKSIGVGQYQHDVDQGQLKHSLDDVVMSCVNNVGVEVNTASMQLLTYVSGLGPTLAGNIVAYRNEHGPFKSLAGLKKVPRLGPKAFEQAAGFLRVRGAKNPLDASAVHPEQYKLVDQIAKDLKCKIGDLIQDPTIRGQINLKTYVSKTVGLPTLQDIVEELAKPGRDPRAMFEVFAFADNVHKPADLTPGMKLPGLVTNVTNFGAFVDVGVHQDGLVHISEMADSFVSDPATVVKVQQPVQVTVMEVDLARNRIALSMRSQPGAARQRKKESRPPRKVEKVAPPPRKEEPAGGSSWFQKALKKQ